MKLVKQSVKILRVTFNPLGLIEEAGRVCYKSENKITKDSTKPFVETLLNKYHHESVIEHSVATMKFLTDRGVTHEMVRHRIASYSQESTRYCNYGKLGVKFIIPVDFKLDQNDIGLLRQLEYHYNRSLENGRTPQQARYFLPNGLKTEIVMTANFREWRHFFNLRTDQKAHPQMRDLATMALIKMKQRVPVIFDDLT